MSIHTDVFNVYYAGFWLFSSAHLQVDAVDHDDPLSLLLRKKFCKITRVLLKTIKFELEQTPMSCKLMKPIESRLKKLLRVANGLK